MTKTSLWQGVMPAITTQFSASGELDLRAFEKNVHAQVNAGASGIILGGTLGEASTLTADEKTTLVKTTQAAVNDQVSVVLINSKIRLDIETLISKSIGASKV